MYLCLTPVVGKIVWPRVLDFLEVNNIERWKFFYVSSIAFHTVLYTFWNLLLWYIYSIEHPFFEQYKVDKENPWPWEMNP
jgi:hypothetical protein